MLDLIRRYRGAFTTIFVVSALGMVISMFGSNSGGSAGLSNAIAARVEDQTVTTNELIVSFQNQMEQAQQNFEQQFKGGSNAETRKLIERMIKSQVTPDRVLQQLIQRRFLVSTAEATGISAAPEMIRDMIQENPAFQRDGKFDPILYRQRVTEPAIYENELAMQAKFNNLNEAFESGAAVLSPEEKAQNSRLQRQYVFEALKIRPRDFKGVSAVSSEEVKKFAADPANAAKLKSYYDRNLKEYQQEEEINANHILFTGDDAEKKSGEVLQEIKAKKITFADAAKKYSQDKSNAPKGGVLGFFPRGRMDGAFEKAAFDLKNKGDLSTPTKSSFGWHLIELVDRKAATKKSFEDVKLEVAEKSLLEDKRVAAAKSFVDGIVASGKVPNEAELKKMNLSWTAQPEWTPLSPTLGSLGNVDANTRELMALSHESPLLKHVMTSGEDLVIVRFKESKDEPKAEAGKNPDPAFSKALEAFDFYLQNRFKELEKNKKIVKSDKVLKDLNTRINGEG